MWEYEEEEFTEETKDLLRRAGIKEKDWAKWGEKLREWGTKAYYEGDTEGLYNLGKFFFKAGFYEKAEEKIMTAKESLAYYEPKLKDIVFFDWEAGRWRSVTTGQFRPAPTEFLWGARV